MGAIRMRVQKADKNITIIKAINTTKGIKAFLLQTVASELNKSSEFIITISGKSPSPVVLSYQNPPT